MWLLEDRGGRRRDGVAGEERKIRGMRELTAREKRRERRIGIYTVSLLSVHKLSRDSKLFVGFDENNCYIQELKENRTVGMGKQFNCLYLFDIDNACKIVSNNFIFTCYVSKSLWHQRLGHPADQVLDTLKTTLNLDNHSITDHLYETCNKAKQTREPFPLSDHKSTKIGELVHLDVWGPYKITSIDGFRYFLTIVDDFSRAVGVYMLQGKDDVMILLIPSSVLSCKSPYFYVYGHDPSLSHFRVFGCLCYATILNNQVKFSSRCVIALAVTNKSPLFQLDVNNAFLYGELDEDIYMTIPQGFASKDNKNKENNFVQSVNDHSLFTKSNNNKFIALLVYVDDIVVTGNCMSEIAKFKSFLKSKKYYLKLLKEYGLLGCKSVSTPMEPNFVLPYIATNDDTLLDNIIGYQKLLGKLIYLAHTRPDISYFVHCLAQYMNSPLKSHLNCALNVLRYLKNALGEGIRYNHSDCENYLKGYSDADWANKKQNTLSKSSTEEEYRSLSSAACEIIWIQKLSFDLKTKITIPVDLFCDNKSALQLAINPVFHERKSIEGLKIDKWILAYTKD
ncbi:ribonuclease H-like domain-containing protein [Tanacetum coccineum]